MVDQTQLISAVLLLALAFISWRWVKAQGDEAPEGSRDKNAPSVTATVVNGKSDNGGNPFVSPTCTLFVEYAVDGKDLQQELEVPPSIFRKYAVPLKKLENDRIKKGIEISRDKLPTIDLHYKKNHPAHIWCGEATKQRNGKTISFTVLAAVFLILGVYFGVTAFIR